MTAWNDRHYARAQEFTRLLSDALGAAGPAASPATAPVAPPVAALPAPPAPSAPGPAGAQPAANLFKKIPWKK